MQRGPPRFILFLYTTLFRSFQNNNAIKAVDSVNLSVKAGEICIFLGPSGCGKTTTLKMINRLIHPTSARVLINGEEDRKSTRLNSSHVRTSYAVFCLKKITI